MQRLLNLLGSLLLSLPTIAQTVPDSTSKPASYTAEVGGVISSTNRTPFWLRANQFGIVPLNGSSATLRLGTTYERPLKKGSKWAAGYGAYVVGNVGAINQVLVPEAYGRIRHGALELWAGRRRQVIGLTDTLLTSGSYSWSGNALPITRVQVGTTGFAPIGFTKGILAINAFIAHGWFPATDSLHGSFLHQKALYGRIGKPSWPVRLYGGMVHNVQWGGYSDFVFKRDVVTKDGKLPSSFKNYLELLLARQPESGAEDLASIDQLNQIGNHLGNIDVGIEVAGKHWSIMAYMQHPFEDKSGAIFMNLPDGLYGLRFINTNTASKPFVKILRATVEYLTTRNQSGPTHLRPDKRYGGADNYFNNYQYQDGWVAGDFVLGTPFITRWQDGRISLFNPVFKLTINNNAVNVAHVAFLSQFKNGLLVEGRASLSQNYGFIYHGFDKNIKRVDQTSLLLKSVLPLRTMANTSLTIALAMDRGDLYDNAFGGFIGIRKTW